MGDKKTETIQEWEARRKKSIEAVMNLRLFDDILMTVAFKDNPEAVACILRVLLGDPKIEVAKVIVQDTYTNLYGRGVRLDIHAIDRKGRHFNLD